MCGGVKVGSGPTVAELKRGQSVSLGLSEETVRRRWSPEEGGREKGASSFPSSIPVFTVSFKGCTHFEGLKFLPDVLSVAAVS